MGCSPLLVLIVEDILGCFVLLEGFMNDRIETWVIVSWGRDSNSHHCLYRELLYTMMYDDMPSLA